jgi:hypothetical protein
MTTPYFPDDIPNERIDDAPHYILTADDLAFIERRLPAWREDQGNATARDRGDAVELRLAVEVAFCRLYGLDPETNIRKKRSDSMHSFTIGGQTVSVVATTKRANMTVSKDKTISDTCICGLVYDDGSGRNIRLIGALNGRRVMDFGPRTGQKGAPDFYLVYGICTVPVADWLAGKLQYA